MSNQPSPAEHREQRRGLNAIIVLAVLTILEYFVAVGLDSASMIVLLLSVVALLKAVVILEYFMHLSKVWRGEGSH